VAADRRPRIDATCQVNPDFRGAAAACSACGGSSAAAVRHAEAVSLCVLPFKHSGGERRSMPLPLKINFQTILADKYALTKRIVPEMTVLFQNCNHRRTIAHPMAIS